MKKITNIEFIKRLKEIHKDNIIPLGDYINARKLIKFKCSKHNHEFYNKAYSMLNALGCPVCRLKFKTHEEFIEHCSKLQNNEFIYLSSYQSMNDPITVKCSKGHISNPILKSHLKGHGCQQCLGEKLSSLTRLSNSEFLEHLKKIHGDLYIPLEEYKGTHTKIDFLCTENNHKISMYPNNILKGHGCKSCRGTKSKGEIKIKEFLLSNSIKFQREKTFEDCKHINKLPFDFIIYDEIENIRYLIEYQGPHHYRPVKFGGSMLMEEAIKNHENTKRNDIIKKDWCIKNNIKLLEIKYTDIKKIDKILKIYLL